MPTSARHRHYALAVLTLVYVFNFLDRQLLAILVEPIKAEFGATDTQMGLLYGLAFALFYATLAIPVAHLADRHNRRNIVAVAATLWSALTVACGFAANYWQLFVLRAGVAVGEAGGVPPSQSMITDHYPPEQRALAMAVFSSGTFIGSLIAFVGGAYIAQHYGWRMAFVVVGAPGIALALLLRFTTQEPPRGQFDAVSEIDSDSRVGFRETLAQMWAVKSMRMTLIGCGFASMAGYALGYWAPSFLIRVHEVSIVKAGVLVGTIGISCGLIGSLIGAAVCDRLARENRRWMLLMPTLSLALSLPLIWAFLYWPQASVSSVAGYSFPTAIWFFCLGSLVGSWWAAPTFVAVQEVVAPGQRTLACAILLFVMNMVGFGLGPYLVGAVSDFLAPEHGELSLRYSLMIIMSAYLFAVLFYYRAAHEFNLYGRIAATPVAA
ncbi:MAG: MFS transporter [Gammaproteobacteria bacterium]|nr:MFS transporter [Gammaproteobacteria bacterium]